MISFSLSLLLLVVGYFFYGRLVERVFGPDDRKTPAVAKADGVDYIVLPGWKVFMIQFLNIAGTGPIFGAIMGAKFGPAAYLWIVFGCIFAGAVHDYLCGMLSMRHDGASLPELVGVYLGRHAKTVLLIFSIVVLLMVGTVFVYSPALILGGMTGGTQASIMLWVAAIFCYYALATMLPIDKIIGKIYPLFAFALLFMAVALGAVLFVKWPALPEVWDMATTENLAQQPVFPCLFITIACGAVSGFHATQSPLMARCLSSERKGRPVFYGAMITEGVVALIWATVASWFFYDGGAAEVGSTAAAQAPEVVTAVSNSWLGIVGGILAILGVVAAPITSGDTAFRSARLIVADFLHFSQHPVRNRLLVSLPLFGIAALLLWYNVADKDGFNTIWNYFGWSNQTLACFMLWTATVYLARRSGLRYLIALLPALFMTMVCTSFLCTAKIGFGLDLTLSIAIGALASGICLACFIYFRSTL
ncbi:MAG: carbon starvation protein A [Alloprevotella sp.]|nr:carbon starvation protein A [Alloprevotella sp.]MBR1594923.1 carbon starvation protein A [Alloprevotella sp.]